MALAMTLAGAILLWALGASDFRFRGFAAFLAGLSAAACLWGALRGRNAGAHATVLDWLAAATLLFAPLAALGLAVRQVTFEPSLYQLHQLGRSLPSASLHAFAFAGALLVGTRGRRWSAAPLLVGTAWLVVATPGLRPLFAPDPLLDEARSSPSAATREVQAQVVCAVGDERRARVWAFDPAAGARRAFGSLAIRSPRVAIGPEFAVLVCRDHRTPTDEAGPKTALLIRLPVSRTEKH